MTKIKDLFFILKLSVLLQYGRKFWLMFPLVLIWPLSLSILQSTGWGEVNFVASDVQNILIGFPLYCLAIAAGIKIIAGDVEKKTLEINFTIPSGIRKAWISKLVSNILIIIIAECFLALFSSLVLTAVSVSAFYLALQGALFYLVCSLWAGALFKSELLAAMFSGIVLTINLNFTGSRWLPLFVPSNALDVSASVLTQWTIQNGLFTLFLILGFIKLTDLRLENREKMLNH